MKQYCCILRKDTEAILVEQSNCLIIFTKAGHKIVISTNNVDTTLKDRRIKDIPTLISQITSSSCEEEIIFNSF